MARTSTKAVLVLCAPSSDEATFNAAWEAGQKMTPEEAVAYALEDTDG